MAMAAALRARPVRPGRRARRERLRPHHLVLRLRRRHGGGHLLRGQLDRRPPAARQPGPALRRQPHLDRGRHQGRVQRGRRRRATRPTAGTSSTSTTSTTSRRCTTRSWRRGTRPREPSLISVRSIIGWPAPTKQNTGKAHGSGARRRGGREDQGDPRLRPDGQLLLPGRGARSHPQGGRSRPRPARRVAGGLRRLGQGAPRPRRRARPDLAAAAARGLGRQAARLRRREVDGHPQGQRRR